MKTLVVVLALCVCGGTTVHSQITLTPAECRAVINRLDTLDYLRAGNKILTDAVPKLELACYQKDTIIYLQDSSLQALQRIKAESDAQAARAARSEYKWRGLALGACGTAVLSMAGLVLVLLAR